MQRGTVQQVASLRNFSKRYMLSNFGEFCNYRNTATWQRKATQVN